MKRMSVVVFLAVAVCVVVLAGCGGSGTKIYTRSDTNITAKVGAKFVIKLESNQTTGFQWGITGSLNSSVVKKVSSKYIAGKSAKGEVGVGGTEEWTFQAMGTGTAKFVMVYAQPFNKQVKPAETVVFNVTVQ
jgi:predicted secreted protein